LLWSQKGPQEPRPRRRREASEQKQRRPLRRRLFTRADRDFLAFLRFFDRAAVDARLAYVDLQIGGARQRALDQRLRERILDVLLQGAPERPGADSITREAYSHEVSSVGWWPGSGTMSGPAFYSYAAPEPQGFKEAHVRPAAARYDAGLGEFLLDYDAVRAAPSPSANLLAFCQSTYDAAADLAKWDRQLLERDKGRK